MNSKERCYFCKKELFEKLGEIKDKYKCDIIMDGANYDDLKDFRPGSKAEKEFHLLKPTSLSHRALIKHLMLSPKSFLHLMCWLIMPGFFQVRLFWISSLLRGMKS